METTTGNQPAQRRRDARARLALALLWLVLGSAAAVGLLIAASGSPTGRSCTVAAACLLVADLAAILVAVANRGLMRDPDRTDLGGVADLASFAVGLDYLLGVVVIVVAARPFAFWQLPLLLLGTALFLGLGLVAVATSHGTRQARVAQLSPTS